MPELPRRGQVGRGRPAKGQGFVTQAQAAKAVGVSERTFRRLLRVRRDAPDLEDLIAEGWLTLGTAERLVAQGRAAKATDALMRLKLAGYAPVHPAGRKR